MWLARAYIKQQRIHACDLNTDPLSVDFFSPKDNNLGVEEIKYLSEAMKCNTTLTELDISCTYCQFRIHADI